MRWLVFLLILISWLAAAQSDPVEPLNVSNQFSSDSLVVIGEITLEGNKKTRDKIVFREIEFKPGDILKISQLEELIVKSRQNLINRSLFNFVTITRTPNEGAININVEMVERWYIWPIPIINTAGRNLNAWWETRDFGQLNYGVDLRVENFRGRMERLNFIVQAGFDQMLEARWTVPYLTPNQYFGMGVSGGYQRNHQVAYTTEDNKLVFYNAQNGYAQKRGFASVDFTFRPKFNFLHTISLGFEHYQFQDTLLELNPEFTSGDTRYDFLTMAYLYKQDFRDYKPYPLKGYYFDAGIQKYGLGLMSPDIDIWLINFTFDQYLQLYKRWYFAYSFGALFSNKDELPYFLTPGIGYLGMEVRGYELYIVNGQNFGIFKSNVKFEIIPRQVRRINWIKTEKFGKVFYALYANLFFDMGYASDQQGYRNNPLSNQLLWGTGLGIDFVTYYDLVIRFEYTLNKQGDHGFYLNLVAPI